MICLPTSQKTTGLRCRQNSVSTLIQSISTGITHPLVRPKAVWLFRILRDGGVPFDPEAIKGWLLSQGGWTPQGANDVRQVAADVLGGKRLQTEERPWAKDILQQWRDKAAQRQQ